MKGECRRRLLSLSSSICSFFSYLLASPGREEVGDCCCCCCFWLALVIFISTAVVEVVEAKGLGQSSARAEFCAQIGMLLQPLPPQISKLAQLSSSQFEAPFRHNIGIFSVALPLLVVHCICLDECPSVACLCVHVCESLIDGHAIQPFCRSPPISSFGMALEKKSIEQQQQQQQFLLLLLLLLQPLLPLKLDRQTS